MVETHVRLHGPEGLRRMGEPARAVSADPVSFHAELIIRRAPGVTLQVFAATEHESSIGAPRAGSLEGDAVGTTLVVRGRMRVWDRSGCTDVGPGDVVCEAPGEAARWRFLRPTTVIRSLLPASSLPGPLLPASHLPHLIPRTPLVAAFALLMQDVASSSCTTLEADYLWRAFVNLELAVLAEAAGEVDAAPVGLRTRIVDHIAEHLGDPALGPATIANDLGVSVRWVHRSFNDGEISVGRYIRQQRLDRVEAALRTELRISRTGALSRRFGFTGPDQLSRAFRARFGVTIQQYLESLPIPSGPQR